MSTLYELTNEYQMLLDMAEDPDADPQAIIDTMESIGGEIEDKADGYAMVMKELQGTVDTLDAEIKRLKARKEARENNIKRMKEALQAAMNATGKTKFKTALFNFAIAKTAPTLVVDDFKSIPAKYFVEQLPKLDTAKLKDDLKAGADLAGVAHLESGQCLRIR